MVGIADTTARQAPLAFTVSVNPVGGRGVAVSNTTAPSGTNPATPGTEYTASSANAKVATFTGQMSGSITIPAIAESVDDMAGVTLNATTRQQPGNNPVNANIGAATATGTITDELGPGVTLSRTFLAVDGGTTIT